MTIKYTVNARMPYLSEVGATGCDIENYELGTCPGWMVDYLYDAGYQTHVVNDVYGYWILSFRAYDSVNVRRVGYDVTADYNLRVDNDDYVGVRPVINLNSSNEI